MRLSFQSLASSSARLGTSNNSSPNGFSGRLDTFAFPAGRPSKNRSASWRVSFVFPFFIDLLCNKEVSLNARAMITEGRSCILSRASDGSISPILRYSRVTGSRGGNGATYAATKSGFARNDFDRMPCCRCRMATTGRDGKRIAVRWRQSSPMPSPPRATPWRLTRPEFVASLGRNVVHCKEPATPATVQLAIRRCETLHRHHTLVNAGCTKRSNLEQVMRLALDRVTDFATGESVHRWTICGRYLTKP